jgi:predicted permease
MNMINLFDSFIWDLRYSLRQLVRNKLFTAVAILSLGVGIGATTAIFSVINSLLLATLPVRDANQLIMLTSPNSGGRQTGMADKERDQITYPEYTQLREQLTTLSGLCVAQASLDEWQVRIGGGLQERVFGKLVSEDYFSVLGVDPALGRVFNSSDTTASAQDPYVVISYDFWQRRFDGQASVLGTPITLNGTSLTIIGVTSRGFKGESVAWAPDLWIPMMMQPLIYPGKDWLHENPADSVEKVMWLNAFGRLSPGANVTKVQAEVDVVFARMMQAFYPPTLTPELQSRALSQYLVVREASGGTFPGREDVASQLQILLAFAALVLLISCANVANLLLGRVSARQRETSIRLALGATRLRLYRQLITENLLLWALGGIAGLLIALNTSHILVSLISDPSEPFAPPGAPDWRVLGFTAAVVLVTGVLFGVVPAQRAVRMSLASSLRESSRGLTQSGRRMNLAKFLVAGQVGLSLLLMVGTGLLVRTLWNLQTISLGYPAERLLQVDVDGGTVGYKGEALPNFYDNLADRLSAVPGVSGVAYSELGLMTGGESRCRIKVDGVIPEREENRRSHYDYISPGYFALLGVPLIMGRDIEPQDTANSKKVCVINEELARRVFPGVIPLGRELTALSPNNSSTMEVVGVVKAIRSSSLRDQVPPIFYAPARQTRFNEDLGPAVFQIRTSNDPKVILPNVLETVQRVNPDAPIIFSGAIKDFIANQMLKESQIAYLCLIFGVLALLLAAVGLYGVLSNSISRRRNEIGIRMALGAAPGMIIRMILIETTLLTALGVLGGVVAAALSTQVIESWLYGLGRMDPITILFAIALVVGVALVAAFVPAARAGRVNPLEALRHE